MVNIRSPTSIKLKRRDSEGENRKKGRIVHLRKERRSVRWRISDEKWTVLLTESRILDFNVTSKCGITLRFLDK